jgi:AbrB family looped-hinge helix DNA binding protein
METTIEVTPFGQITIPKDIQDLLGIEAGQVYGLRTLEGGVLVLTPQSGKTATVLRQMRNALLNKGASPEGMMADLRRLRETDEE